MATQQGQLVLDRCLHCSVAKPNLEMVWETNTNDHSQRWYRHWVVYRCSSCGGLILTAAEGTSRGYIVATYPSQRSISEAIPERTRAFLTQATESMHSPSGAVMLTASAVDAMLKAKGYKDGSLNARIDEAAKVHMITDEMAAWAHEVRLDANDQRHADEDVPLPTEKDAKKALDFALALAEFMFVLPERVRRGRKQDVQVA